MGREELALQTQLLLQEASHLSQGAPATDAEASALVEGDAPAVSELEAARQALLDKLKRKKEQRRAQMQQINQKRYSFGGVSASKTTTAASPTSAAGQSRLTPVKAKAAFKPPVAASTGVAAHKKKDLLARLRQQAIQQGAQNMAKMFGYASYEEQIKNLNLLEKRKILESEKREQSKEEEEEEQRAKQVAAEEEEHDEDDADNGLDPMEQEGDTEPTLAAGVSQISASSSPRADPAVDSSAGAISTDAGNVMRVRLPTAAASESESVRVKRRNRIDEDEDDGNEAGSEQDGEDNDEDRDNDDKMEVEDAGSASTRSVVDASASSNAAATSTSSPAPKKDRSAAYRELLRAEALATRRRKRLVKGGGGANFVESEAEEDEEEDALKIGGLGDFGFGVPQAKTQESKESEEERNALKLRADDLEGIVDDLSDDEQAQQQDLDEIFRKELEEQDREQVKEVMRNVKEGFGRNRRAFSAGFQSGEARGRFNLDELVAADGSKFEAARLGLLESDEEWSEDETGKKTKRSRRADRGEDGEGEGEDDDDEEEDEEAEMERMLRERYKSQPQIYVTSSESEGEEEEDAQGKGDAAAGADAGEANSDEEREKQQMKLFSERARINRRMARMKDLQRQISLENGDDEEGKKASAPAMPNLLLEEDEDSQELLKLLNRTDVSSSASTASAATSAVPGSAKMTHGEGKRGAAGARPRPMLGRFNSFGSASSFHRVAGNCNMFSAGSGSSQASKGFVFTSLGSERPEQGDALTNDESELPPPASRPELGKSKSWGQPAHRTGKRGADAAAATGAGRKSKKPKRASDFFSVLSSYQVVPSSSNHSAPL